MPHQMTVKELIQALQHEVEMLETEKDDVTMKLLDLSKEVERRHQLIRDLTGIITPFE